MTTDSFSKIEEGDDSKAPPPPDVDLENLIPTIEEKRKIIKYLLKHNFPIRPYLFFTLCFLLIGVAAIALEVVLIIDGALNYKIANGIWAGFFSIVNGSSKLLLCNFKFLNFLIFFLFKNTQINDILKYLL